LGRSNPVKDVEELSMYVRISDGSLEEIKSGKQEKSEERKGLRKEERNT
jgi:hypothetical protein